MKCDYVGIELLKIAAFLFAARYIAAALFIGPGLKNWNSALFNSSYQYVGSGLTVGAGISAAAGIAMLIVAAKKKTA
jgi:mannose/fructose/N-acetylgalactosamine-specific phosphotransferase system component IIC